MIMMNTTKDWYPRCKHDKKFSELIHVPGGFKLLCIHNQVKKPCLERGPLIEQEQLEALLIEVAEM